MWSAFAYQQHVGLDSFDTESGVLLLLYRKVFPVDERPWQVTAIPLAKPGPTPSPKIPAFCHV